MSFCLPPFLSPIPSSVLSPLTWLQGWRAFRVLRSWWGVGGDAPICRAARAGERMSRVIPASPRASGTDPDRRGIAAPSGCGTHGSGAGRGATVDEGGCGFRFVFLGWKKERIPVPHVLAGGERGAPEDVGACLVHWSTPPWGGGVAKGGGVLSYNS